MLTVVSENQSTFEQKELLMKFVEFSRYFEPRVQVMDGSNFYKGKVVDAE
jgi:hypothetical protein